MKKSSIHQKVQAIGSEDRLKVREREISRIFLGFLLEQVGRDLGRTESWRTMQGKQIWHMEER